MLVDQINILDKDSEDKHEFLIKEAKDSYRSRQKLKYPDEHRASRTSAAPTSAASRSTSSRT